MIHSKISPLSRDVVRTHRKDEDKTIKRLLKYNFKIVEVLHCRGGKVQITATRRFTL